MLLGLGLAPAPASGEGGGVSCDPLVATWIGGPSGELDAPRSWSTGLTPGPGTTVQFVNPAPVLASLTETDLSVRRVLVRGAKVELEILETTLEAASPLAECPAIEIGGPGPAELDVFTGAPPPGTPPGSVIASSLVLGTTHGPGRLQLFPGQLHVHESVVVGDAATGGIRQSGRLSCHRMVVARGAVGTVEQLFLLEVADDLVVGEADLGMLWVAASDVGRLVIGARRTGLGTVNVHTGTDHLVRGDAIVGQRGLGVLSIRRPLIVEGSVVLGADAEFEQVLILDRGDGWVIVEGGSGALRVGEDLVLGQLGHALLDVRSPGRVVVDGSVRFEADAPGAPEAVDRHVRLELGPAAEEEAAVIEAAGDVALPALEVVLPDDVPIAAGDTWRLVQAGGSLDLPTPSLPYLPTGLQWQLAVEDGVLLASIVDVPSHDGDLDDDGDVDVHDLLTLLQSFGPCPVIDPCFADLDVNGTVDTIDLWLLVLQWG